MRNLVPFHHRIAVLCIAVAALGCFLVSKPVHAQTQETCDQCKWLRCLKSSVAQKQKMIAVYQGLYDFWKGRHLDDAGHPVDVRDLSARSEPERSRIYQATLNPIDGQLAEFHQMEEARTAAVPAAEGCGYPETMPSNPWTEGFETCQTHDLPPMQAVQPCKELADLLQRHEALHVAACRQRQQPNTAYWPYNAPGATKMFPPKTLTPAGKAAEEIKAYQLEIASLKRIIEKLEKRCRKTSFTGVTIDCVMPAGRNKVRMGQKLEGHVCGDPTQAPWTIIPQYFVEAPGVPPVPASSNKPFTNDCVAAGSDIEKRRAEIYRSSRGTGAGGWMCVYREGQPPQITIRYFRLSRCEGPAEQTITVEAEVSDKCEESQEPAPPAPPLRRPGGEPVS